MKKLLITAALVTAIASPAFAQKVKHPRSVDQYAQTAQTKQSARTETRRAPSPQPTTTPVRASAKAATGTPPKMRPTGTSIARLR